jgi:glycogen operon protein
MTEQDWNFPEGRFLSYVLGPQGPGKEALFVVLNAAVETIEFTLPAFSEYVRWTLLLETAPEPRLGQTVAAGAKLQARPRSVLAFSGTA